jgi:ferric-dicitrate binding protein FerR (iron transport regulator)
MMNNQNPKITDELIQRYFQGHLSSDEEEALFLWTKENPENRKKLFRQKDLWQASQIGSQHFNKIEIEQWLALQEKISSEHRKTVLFKEFLRIAAVVVIAIGAGWFGHSFYSSGLFSSEEIIMREVEATPGQTKEIFLTDGTHVWLNSDSKLKFPSSFDSENREVELSGEAYFEVTANENEPFLVKTKNHTVKVTGTKFNICEYPEHNIIETTLEEGRVKIISGNVLKDLFPGQQSSFNTETAKVRISETDFEVYTSWKNGRYEFSNQPLHKIFQIMERWWDVNIEYPEEELKNERISGVLRRYKPLEDHFNVINQLIPIKYDITNDLVKINVR